jgi:hypothetical protein
MTSVNTLEQVDDPVAHISISGVRGRSELNERLANPPKHHHAGNQRAMLGAVAVGAVVGAALMYLLKRD